MCTNLASLREYAAIREPLPARSHRLFWTWFYFGFPAFPSVLGILWLMITRPVG
ncbi:DUF2269 family protein [Rhizobium lentis]|uniref:DUF2269 family protein n=1 Tax=Rhizobium TaxID=379 RepID=UPI003917DD3D